MEDLLAVLLVEGLGVEWEIEIGQQSNSNKGNREDGAGKLAVNCENCQA